MEHGVEANAPRVLASRLVDEDRNARVDLAGKLGIVFSKS
jgi:hypothetical protein